MNHIDAINLRLFYEYVCNEYVIYYRDAENPSSLVFYFCCIQILLRLMLKKLLTYQLNILQVLEEIRLGLELNDYEMQQRRLAHMRLLGELYNYEHIDSSVVFETLYLIICYGYGSSEVRIWHQCLVILFMISLCDQHKMKCYSNSLFVSQKIFTWIFFYFLIFGAMKNFGRIFVIVNKKCSHFRGK